jgi:hypothetical protein
MGEIEEISDLMCKQSGDFRVVSAEYTPNSSGEIVVEGDKNLLDEVTDDLCEALKALYHDQNLGHELDFENEEEPTRGAPSKKAVYDKKGKKIRLYDLFIQGNRITITPTDEMIAKIHQSTTVLKAYIHNLQKT